MVRHETGRAPPTIGGLAPTVWGMLPVVNLAALRLVPTCVLLRFALAIALALSTSICGCQRNSQPGRVGSAMNAELSRFKQEAYFKGFGERVEFSFDDNDGLTDAVFSKMLLSFLRSRTAVYYIWMPSSWVFSDADLRHLLHLEIDWLSYHGPVDQQLANTLYRQGSLRRLSLLGPIALDLASPDPRLPISPGVENFELHLSVVDEKSAQFVSKIIHAAPRLNRIWLDDISDPTLLLAIDFGRFSDTITFTNFKFDGEFDRATSRTINKWLDRWVQDRRPEIVLGDHHIYYYLTD